MNRNLHVTLHLSTASLLAGAAVALGHLPELAVHWWRWQNPLLGLAGALGLLSLWPPNAPLARLGPPCAPR